MSPAPVAAAKSGSGLKILLVVLGCFVVAGILAIGAIFYIGHRVKQAVVEKAASYGVDLPAIAASGSASSSSSAAGASGAICDKYTKEFVSEAISLPIARMEKDGESCMYYGPPGLSMQLARENTEKTFQRAQQPGDKLGAGDVADAVTNMMGSIAAASGKGGSHGESPLVILIVAGDGQTQFTALTATKSIFGGIPGVGSDVPGLGDRAMRLGNLGLNVLKGDTIIRIIPGPLPDVKDKTIALARAVLSRL